MWDAKVRPAGSVRAEGIMFAGRLWRVERLRDATRRAEPTD